MEGLRDRCLVAYHADCTDGFTSAWVCNRWMNEKGIAVDLYPVDYNEESIGGLIDQLSKYAYKELLVVDFSLSLDKLQWLQLHKPHTEVFILDHHKTAFEEYAPGQDIELAPQFKHRINGAYVILDNNESGASLCWQYFYGDLPGLPWLIKYVKDYDLWKFEYGNQTKWMSKIFKKAEHTFKDWEYLYDTLEDEEGAAMLIAEGKELQEYQDKRTKQYVEMSTANVIAGTPCRLVECPRWDASEAGNAIAAKYGCMAAMFSIDLDREKVMYSLRSSESSGIDVSAVAKSFGGGGHKHAAGFEVNLDQPVLEDRI